MKSDLATDWHQNICHSFECSESGQQSKVVFFSFACLPLVGCVVSSFLRYSSSKAGITKLYHSVAFTAVVVSPRLAPSCGRESHGRGPLSAGRLWHYPAWPRKPTPPSPDSEQRNPSRREKQEECRRTRTQQLSKAAAPKEASACGWRQQLEEGSELQWG